MYLPGIPLGKNDHMAEIGGHISSIKKRCDRQPGEKDRQGQGEKSTLRRIPSETKNAVTLMEKNHVPRKLEMY